MNIRRSLDTDAILAAGARLAEEENHPDQEQHVGGPHGDAHFSRAGT
jgi:hypothetical protein